MMYGIAHPLSFNSGGNPDDIRILDAAAIKHFHELNYYLGNMGAITALPKNLSLESVLKEIDLILNKLQPVTNQKKPNNVLPVKQPASAGKIDLVEYPSENAAEPGQMVMAYPPERTLSVKEDLLINIFLTVFAGDPSTNLYKKFIDSKSKEIDLGAQGVFAYIDNNQGQPIFIGLNDLDISNLTVEKATLVRQKINEELLRISTFKDGSPELQAFNNRFSNALTDYRRGIAKFTNTPPKFGYRDTYEAWYQHLNKVNRLTEFRKSVVNKPQFEEIEAMLKTGKNFWSEYLNKWHLLNTVPYVVMARANTNLLAAQDSAAKSRAAKELVILKAKYKVKDDQEAIQKYKAEYDANTAVLEKLEQDNEIKFIDNPPLTLDDQLDFKTALLSNKIPIVSSSFNNMTSASTGIAFRLDNLSSDQLVYLSMLPELLTQTGIIKEGKAVSYEEMVQLQRQEILSLNCNYSANLSKNRVELVVKGAGNNIKEAQQSVKWMNDILQTPNWSIGNISRIRDLVNQVLSAKRKTMQAREEEWVEDPANAYRVQDKPLLMATSSFLTATHNIHRLRWMLMDAGDINERNAAAAYLDVLGKVNAGKDDLKILFKKLQSTEPDTIHYPLGIKNAVNEFKLLSQQVKKTAIEAAKDLEQIMNDIPDASLTEDWQYLCKEMKRDLLQTPEKTLVLLNETRKAFLHTDNARVFVIGSDANQAGLKKNIEELLGRLSTVAVTKATYSTKKLVDERVKQRLHITENPVYVGLVNPNSATGVFINSVPLITYQDTSREKLLQFLAAQLFGGGGKNSVYTKTTGAGLSYSTGVGTSASSGLFRYYAERTPLLPQTLSFVIDEIKRTPNDPAMSEYIISLCTSASRASSEYEARGEAMAADIADGNTSAVVSNFRKAVLQLRKMPGLMDEVYKRKDAVYERLLPGYGMKMKDVKGGIYYVIGGEKQMAAYESYLKSKDGEDTQLFRLYPRDYWMIAE